jgi:trans-aconitate methyltransferase
MTIGADWEDLSQLDPLWAILADPKKRGGKWELAEFLALGEQHVAALMAKADGFRLPENRTRCLDFGCGVGRLTRAMRGYFAQCHGVDVAIGMVEQARRLTPDCTFHHNPHPDLRAFESSSFDMVYSFIVLQHVGSQEAILRYVEEFVRILVPGGLLVFQVPDRMSLRSQLAPKRRLHKLLRHAGVSSHWLHSRGLDPMRMEAVTPGRVVERIVRAGGHLISSESDDWSGPGISSRTYYASKPVQH